MSNRGKENWEIGSSKLKFLPIVERMFVLLELLYIIFIFSNLGYFINWAKKISIFSLEKNN